MCYQPRHVPDLRLEHFDPATFGGLVCDESSAIKSFDGVRRAMVTEFARQIPFRLLGTATAAPNSTVELSRGRQLAARAKIAAYGDDYRRCTWYGSPQPGLDVQTSIVAVQG